MQYLLKLIMVGFNLRNPSNGVYEINTSYLSEAQRLELSESSELYKLELEFIWSERIREMRFLKFNSEVLNLFT